MYIIYYNIISYHIISDNIEHGWSSPSTSFAAAFLRAPFFCRVASVSFMPFVVIVVPVSGIH